MSSIAMASCPPTMPFKYAPDICRELNLDFQRIRCDGVLRTELQVQAELNDLCKWLSSTPKNTTYRVNLLKSTREVVCDYIKCNLAEYGRPLPLILTIPEIPDLIFIHNWDESVELDLKHYSSEIIVDAGCGAAVLRGAHVFAPGVIGMPFGLAIGDKVSVYADITGKCKKGLVKPYADDNKVFIGNGIIRMTRHALFNSDNATPVSGIAVYMTDIVSRLPQLNNESVPEGLAILQNLPSVICCHVLKPEPGNIILDMCAAPGNKTVHILNLIKGQGLLIALEKNKSKIKRLTENCSKFADNNVQIHCCDSTKITCDDQTKCYENKPPFKDNYFDKILLDGPCSALGQRPQLINVMTSKQLRSYVPLQKKLFSSAVRLLKPKGILVYSTCTITIAENEGIVSWALKTFPYLELIDINSRISLNKYGTPGYSIDGLTAENANKLRRFGPETDSIGFFIACFCKHEISKEALHFM